MSAKDKIKKYEEAEQVTTDQDLSRDKEKKEIKETAVDPAEEIQALQEQLAIAEAESKSNYDQLLRMAAEFDNFKKRAGRELEDFRKYANESVFKELLTVVDNLERAVTSSGNSNGAETCVLEGVKMTLQEILKVFEKFGVKPLSSLGQPFDPAFHQAVMQEETNNRPENTVLKEMQRGYLIHERLLRPAMVVVSKAAAPSHEPDAIETESDTELKQDNA